MDKGLSLRSVASALGVSPSLISQVETGKTQPSVSTLYALVNHLGISFDDLLGESGEAADAEQPGHNDALLYASGSVVQRGVDNPVLEMDNGVRWERLASGVGGPVDPILVTYDVGASSSIEGRLMRHSGVEYAYLLSGELTLHLDFETYVIRARDSLNFDSVRPHMYVNHGTEPAKGLWFVTGRREFTQTMPEAGPQPAKANGTLTSAVDVLRAMDRL